MSPSNLGIVFGPTLMRPKPTGATVSLSSLVDYPRQARIVEALIVFHKQIFTQDAGGLRPPCSPSFIHSQTQVSSTFYGFNGSMKDTCGFSWLNNAKCLS